MPRHPSPRRLSERLLRAAAFFAAACGRSLLGGRLFGRGLFGLDDLVGLGRGVRDLLGLVDDLVLGVVLVIRRR